MCERSRSETRFSPRIGAQSDMNAEKIPTSSPAPPLSRSSLPPPPPLPLPLLLPPLLLLLLLLDEDKETDTAFVDLRFQ